MKILGKISAELAVRLYDPYVNMWVDDDGLWFVRSADWETHHVSPIYKAWELAEDMILLAEGVSR